jgi:hypothetical protein
MRAGEAAAARRPPAKTLCAPWREGLTLEFVTE